MSWSTIVIVYKVSVYLFMREQWIAVFHLSKMISIYYKTPTRNVNIL